VKYEKVEDMMISEEQLHDICTKEETLCARLEGYSLFVTLIDLQTQKDI
jgi:hypothetical protein